jgi:hypothetical protein
VPKFFGALFQKRTTSFAFTQNNSTKMKLWRKFPDQRPPLFLHAGLHKTGTSALQVALHGNAARLKAAGVLYAASGIPEGSSGHHNLAWELARDRRFRARFGTIDDTAREIAAHGGPAILSSEDFETLLDRPAAFNAIVDHPSLAGHRVVFVVYLREQAAYFRSLFLELTEHGLTADMQRLAETIREQGFFDFNEWRFHFDYDRIVAQLSKWRPGTLMLRSHHALTGGSTVTDFLALACPSAALPDHDSRRLLNAQQPLAVSLKLYFETRLAQPLNPAQQAAIVAACAPEKGTPDLSPGLQARLRGAFAAGNASLARTAGFALAGAIGGHGTELHRLPIEALFSFEMQNRLTALADGGWN